MSVVTAECSALGGTLLSPYFWLTEPHRRGAEGIEKLEKCKSCGTLSSRYDVVCILRNLQNCENMHKTRTKVGSPQIPPHLWGVAGS